MGKKTVKQIANDFDMDEDEVMEHLNNHPWQEMRVSNVNDRVAILPPKTGNYQDDLDWCLDILRDLIGEIMMVRQMDGKEMEIDKITKLIRSLKEIIETRGKFDGKFKDDMVIKVEAMEGRFEKLANRLVGSDLCPTCQDKIMRILDEL